MHYKVFLWSSIIILIFLILGGSNNSAYTQDYLWPTNASRLMTSNFCEFRPRHYHAALDIKTWNRTGYRVFAIEDGYVMRVRVSAFGYGKAVYVKLNDGNIVVYAHLEKFWPALEQYVNRIRERQQSYRVDLHLQANQFPVKRGQMIGYTGKTGIGVPHLHFELRNSRNKPINPLQFYRGTIYDVVPPELHQAAFTPLNEHSLINLRADTLFIDLREKTRTQLTDTLLLRGQVGLAVKVYDRANGARNMFNFYRGRMYIDDSLVYTVQYDSFSYFESAQIELDKNFSLWRKNLGIFHNFYLHPANRLPHYSGIPPRGGVIDAAALKEGLHHLKVEIDDFWGNRCQLTGWFYSGKPSALNYDLYQWLDNELFLRIQSPVKLKKITGQARTNQTNEQIPLHLRLMDEMEYQGTYYYALAVKPSPPIKNIVLELHGYTETGISTLPLYLLPSQKFYRAGNSPVFSLLKSRIKHNWVELLVGVNRPKPFNFLNKLKKQLKSIIWFPIDEKTYQVNIPAETLNLNRHVLETLFSERLPFVSIVEPANQSTVISRDKLFKAEFPAGALYEKTAVFLNRKNNFPEVIAASPPYKQIGQIYDLQPFDQPVKDGVWVSLTIPDSSRGMNGLGVYYYDRKKGWLFIPTRWQADTRTFTGRITSLEKFTILQDTIPPLLVPVQSAHDGRLKTRNGNLKFVVKDEMSGIYQESQIVVTINGEWHLFEYDPEEDFLKINVPESTSGLIPLNISVTDNVGNKIMRKFWIR